MEKIIDELNNDERNKVCSKISGLDILLYVSGLAVVECASTNTGNREFILEIYKHIKSCDICRDGYEFSKEVYSKNERYKGLFSKEHFETIRRNEDYLNKTFFNL